MYKYIRLFVIFFVTLVIFYIFLQIKSCNDETNNSKNRTIVQKIEQKKFQAEQKLWTKPIIHIKKLHGEKPYKADIAPLPEKEVQSIVEINLPEGRSEPNLPDLPLTLYIDHKGKVWKSKNFKNVKVTQIHIRKSEIGFCFKKGIAVGIINIYDPYWEKERLKFPPAFILSIFQYKDFFLSGSGLLMSHYKIEEGYLAQKWLGSLNSGIEWMPFKIAKKKFSVEHIKFGVGVWYKLLGSKILPKWWFSIGVKF